MIKIQPLISPQEVIAIARQHTAVSTIDIVEELCSEWNRQTITESWEGNERFRFTCMLATLFNAGRIQGIREERQKRAYKKALRLADKILTLDPESLKTVLDFILSHQKEEALDDEQATA